MQNPEPDPPKSGWLPTQSTVIGGVIGGAIAQLIAAGIETYTGHPLSTATAGAISTLCVAGIGYFFPDGGRK